MKFKTLILTFALTMLFATVTKSRDVGSRDAPTVEIFVNSNDQNGSLAPALLPALQTQNLSPTQVIGYGKETTKNAKTVLNSPPEKVILIPLITHKPVKFEPSKNIVKPKNLTGIAVKTPDYKFGYSMAN